MVQYPPRLGNLWRQARRRTRLCARTTMEAGTRRIFQLAMFDPNQYR
jgi:hypothetical protein